MAIRTHRTLLCQITLMLSLSLSHALECGSQDTYFNQVLSHIPCPLDELDDDNATLGTGSCNYSTTLQDRNCNGKKNSCQKNICVEILDSNSGMLNITFPFLSNSSYTSYTVSLCNQTGECYSVPDRILLSRCVGFFCKNSCSKTLSVVFHYVRSDVYKIKVLPSWGDISDIPFESQLIEINTNYSQDLNPAMKNGPCSNASCEVQISYQKCPPGFELGLFHKGKKHLKCIAKSSVNTIVCTPEDAANVTGSCFLESNIIQCEFFGLKEGTNYSVDLGTQVKCKLKSDKKTSSCKWNYNFTTDSVKPLPEPPQSNYVKYIAPFVIFGLLVLVGRFLWKRKIGYRRSYKDPNENIPFRPMSEHPRVLLLYARDCEPFLQVIHHLKLVLCQVYNCEVEDFWEDSHYSVVSQNPSRWLLSRLANQRVMIMLVTNLPSLLQEAALLRGATITYRKPTAFDSLFTQALSTLHDTATSSTNPYSRVFVVRLDDTEEGRFPRLARYISPAIRYVLPIHLNTLITALYNLNSGVSINVAEDQIVTSFIKAISGYRQFLESEPQYFYMLFRPENSHVIEQILTEAS